MPKRLQQAEISAQNMFAVMINTSRKRERDARETFRARQANMQWRAP
ncbi:MAG: hypothetical protein O9343_19365 [Burkholderiaceae bacterium]|jgi:hypothetical protein|nr:hypothetical protein [Burkholderiaceae bacterium]MCZ8177338.1 hypothetical protein [Burkholderiaceae bacterium]